jgi:uncharacterized protein (TIRG00374 family)
VLFWIALPIVLWLSFRSVPVSEVWNTLNNLSLESILLLLALNGFILIFFSSRWWLILRAQGHRRSYWSLVGYRIAGFGITYFTPGPQVGGEPLQVYLLTQREKIPTPVAMASVTLDKMLELLANFTFLLVGITTILVSGVLGEASNFLFLLLPLGLLILPAGYLLALWSGAQPATKFLRILAGRFPGSPRLARWPITLQAVEEESGQFFHKHPGTIMAAVLISFLIWILLVFEFALAVRFLGLRLSLPEVITVLTAARLAFLLPIPAGIGTLETGQMLAMGLIGANPVIGISLSLLIRLRDAALGGLGLWWGGWLTR